MALILFLLSLFGNLSVIRLLGFFRARALISTELLTKIGTVMCASLQLLLITHFHRVFFVIIMTIALISLLALILWRIERQQIDALKKEFPVFIDRWLLNLKLGESISSARTAALRISSGSFRTLLEPLFLTVSTHTKPHLILSANHIDELRLLTASPHSAVARLETLRQMIRKADEFRRKSGQATRQTMIQSVVLLCLQIALSVFTVAHFGWERTRDLILLSFLISGCGLVLMRQFTRKAKWKI